MHATHPVRSCFVPPLVAAALALASCTPGGVSFDDDVATDDDGAADDDAAPGDDDSAAPDDDSAAPDDDATAPADDDATPPPPACAPAATTATPYLKEGDVLDVTLACTSGEDPARFEPSALTVLPGASFDAEAWTWRWPTGPADAGRREVTFHVVPAEDPDAPPEAASLTVWIAEVDDAPGNVPADPLAYTEEWGLPVLHLAVGAEIGEEYRPATITFDGTAYAGEAKLRGASSLSYPKNSYTLAFGVEDLDAERFGIPRRKDHLVLISTFDDNSYVRQKLVYDVFRDLAAWSGEERLYPRTFFTVLYLDGAYVGLYVAAEHVDDELAEEIGLDPGGNLYKAINHDANFYRTTASGHPKPNLHLGYEKKEGTPEDGEPGAWDDLDALVAFSADSGHAAFMAEADAWIRVEEFMDWFLLVHWASADDSGGKNAYLYDDPSAREFRHAPWDFNHAFGQDWMTLRIPYDAYNDFTWTNGIFAHFQVDPEAADALWTRFLGQLDGPLAAGAVRARIEAYVAAIDPSARRDEAKWREQYLAYGGWAWYRDQAADWTDYDGEIAYLLDWIERREPFLRGIYE